MDGSNLKAVAMNRSEFETILIANPAAAAMAALGMTSHTTADAFHIGLRDDNSTRVFKDQSGVIFLERAVRSDDWFESKGYEPPETEKIRTTRDILYVPRPRDDERRFEALQPLIEGAHVCDYWMGTGGFAALSVPVAASVCGVDPRDAARSTLRQRLGTEVAIVRQIEDLAMPFDVITLFSVLECSRNPIGLLRRLQEHLVPGGHLIVEVPNARNTLIEDVEIPAYRDYVFSTEQLVLHTRESLAQMLSSVGFVDIDVIGVQRYGLTTHTGWLVDGQPHGQERYADKANPALERLYEERLAATDRTDTLLAFARRA